MMARGKLCSRQEIPANPKDASCPVDTTGLGGEIITAAMKENGLGSPISLSCTTMIERIPRAYKLDEIRRISVDDEKAAHCLSHFALGLNIGLDERALIVVIGRRGQSVKMLRRWSEPIREYLIEEFKVAPYRLMETRAGFGKDEAIQLWVVQNGASPH